MEIDKEKMIFNPVSILNELFIFRIYIGLSGEIKRLFAKTLSGIEEDVSELI